MDEGSVGNAQAKSVLRLDEEGGCWWVKWGYLQQVLDAAAKD